MLQNDYSSLPIISEDFCSSKQMIINFLTSKMKFVCPKIPRHLILMQFKNTHFPVHGGSVNKLVYRE